MLMKSVIINLKYLIFRSVSATEGGCLEERRWRRGGNVWGLGGWGVRVEAEELCCSVSLICIRCFKDGSNQSASAVFFVFFFCPATC